MIPIHSTTILAVLRNKRLALAGDGQVTVGNTVMKGKAIKLRRLNEDKVLAGFAGSAADGLTLFEKFEGKLKEYSGNLKRAAVELAKDWRTDKFLRRLEALLIVANTEEMYTLSGNGDIIEPDDGMCAIGSGGPFALAAARALSKHTKFTAQEIVKEAMDIAADICIYTNHNIVIETLGE